MTRTTELPDLGVEHALLLQGPAGPFMRRFADDLIDAGIAVTKVNFHAGDALFFRGPDAIAYRGAMHEFGPWVEDLMVGRGVDGLFVFGDCRPLHRVAIEIAERRGIRVYAFEEGYLRPHWITLEPHGVNGHSRMPRDPAFYRALDLEEPPEPTPIPPGFGPIGWYSTFNALAFTLLNRGFEGYRHHRELNAWKHTAWHVRSYLRKQRFARLERGVIDRFTGPLSGRYFFVPLQVHCDFQLTHSPYDEVLDFVDEVLDAFREHADPSDHLLFKHHPMDRAYREYGDFFRERARSTGLGERLHYVHDLHLPTLLQHAKGCITINSTVGLQSIHHRCPVKVMGHAVYDMPGLTAQGSLADFLREREPPDQELFDAYRRYLLHTTQVNGSFYKRAAPTERGAGFLWSPPTPLLQSRLCDEDSSP